MRNLSKPTKAIIKWIIIVAVAMMIIGAVIYRSLYALPFAFSVAILAGVNILKMWMLDRTVNKISDMDDVGYGKTYVKFQYLVRYFGTAIVVFAIGFLYLYTTIPIVNIWGAIAGIFTMQIAVLIVRFKKFDEDSPSITAKQSNPQTENSQDENLPQNEADNSDLL